MDWSVLPEQIACPPTLSAEEYSQDVEVERRAEGSNGSNRLRRKTDINEHTGIGAQAHMVSLPGLRTFARRGYHVTALDGTLVIARSNSHVCALRGSQVTALPKSHVTAMAGSRIVAFEGSFVTALPGAIVVERPGAHVEYVECEEAAEPHETMYFTPLAP